MKKTIALTLAASALFLAGCHTPHHATSWEYKTVTVTSDSDEQLNQLVEQGWRVESFTATFPPSGPLFKVYLLKRGKK
jgi:protein involved in sex pheromone biosynthesis